jgi:HEAT repeat protein
MVHAGPPVKPVLILLLLLTPSLAEPQDAGPVRSARTVLEQGAADGDPDVRRQVAVALALSSRRDRSINLLEKLAADKDHLVREAAIVSIGELHEARLAKAAHDALDDGVPEVAYAAARTLFKLNQPEGKQLLLEIVEGESPAKSGFVRHKVRDVVRQMKRPKSATMLAVKQTIGFVPVPGVGEGFSALTSLVGDPNFSGRATTLLILASDHSAEVRRLIEQAFNDSDWSMRAAAAQIAASRNERVWRFRLVPLFEDSNPRVRYRAAAAFLRLSVPAAVTPP